ncbi:hypothetical protein NQZ68_020891 [Dissostichus eleginoides]|nr:hypothetical protein NQZ68_020891 [Dissostichus eleginoides]
MAHPARRVIGRRDYRQGRATPRKYIQPSSTTPKHGARPRELTRKDTVSHVRPTCGRSIDPFRVSALTGSGRSIMNFILETLQVLLMSIWYNLESFVHLFVPRKRKNIEGEVVLISGAGSGIGRLMAQEFAALNTVLVLWDINQEGMKETARLAKESGASRVHYYLCDCSDKNEVYRVADQRARHF